MSLLDWTSGMTPLRLPALEDLEGAVLAVPLGVPRGLPAGFGVRVEGVRVGLGIQTPGRKTRIGAGSTIREFAQAGELDAPGHRLGRRSRTSIDQCGRRSSADPAHESPIGTPSIAPAAQSSEI